MVAGVVAGVASAVIASVWLRGDDRGAQAPAPDRSERTRDVAAAGRYLDGRKQTHFTSTVDPGWAPETARALRADLVALPGAQFKLLELDCRRTTCFARLEWPNRQAAEHGRDAIAIANLRVNCQRDVVVPPGDDQTGPVQGQMYLDCADWKAAGSPLP